MWGNTAPTPPRNRRGFLPGDILLQVDQCKDRLTESAQMVHLLQKNRRGEELPTRLPRDGRQLGTAPSRNSRS